MKLIFGDDVTGKKKDDGLNYECFVDKRLTAEQMRALEESQKLRQTISEEFEPSQIICWIGNLAVVGAIGFIAIITEVIFESSWQQFWQDLSWMLYALIACVVIGAGYLVYFYVKGKRALQDEKIQRDIERVDSLNKSCCDILEIPEDAETVDVFGCIYRMKNGEPSIKKVMGVSFHNGPFGLFGTDDAVCIASLSERIAFPRAELTGIRTINKRVVMAGWNKPTHYKKGEYKQYRMTLASGGGIIIRQYHALCMMHDGEEYELYFPPYELPAFERVTGLKAETAE